MKKIVLIVSVAMLLIVGALLAVGSRWYIDNKRPNFTESVDIYVREGMTVESLIASIPSEIVINKKSLSRTLHKGLDSTALKPGHYLVEKSKPSVYVVRMLKFGWQTPVNMVLSGTIRKKEVIARKIANQMMIDSASVVKALNDTAILSKYGFTPSDVFSLFIPDTYQLYWTASIEEILDSQKKAYDDFWSSHNLRKAENLGLTPKQVSVLASIVRCESNYTPELPSIAGVYLNRLAKGMKLQADPTVAYCFGFTLNRVLLVHLQADSPYNTYQHEGLPPGPICVPGRECLEAVLNPDRHGYLFFCANAAMDGTHKFAVTLSEHNRNAREFQRALTLKQAREKSK